MGPAEVKSDSEKSDYQDKVFASAPAGMVAQLSPLALAITAVGAVAPSLPNDFCGYFG